MLSKQEQRNWIKIEYSRGRTARQCHQGLQEACGESALPYRTVAMWNHHENQDSRPYYCSFLEHNLRPALRKKRRHFLQNPPIILQDSARPHAAQAAADLFERWGWEVLYHPPYSPDLSPCDFDLIPKMKEPLRGVRFRTVPEILQAGDRSIRTINTTGAAKGILDGLYTMLVTTLKDSKTSKHASILYQL
ncbi:hypothetical protein B7P43_G12732 [Cryptotermes secundus]|uniref:Tc1-like transposase DDE domain-containing protein n=1 Tax=Cryptotermes secundus TaxID=105785 RepID=A0A2J7PYV9_9NEOP|nr:hypothetical protein B7P43_G12732 [Cryptotermes secundus]